MKLKPLKLFSLVLIAALVIVLAGCGSSQQTASDSSQESQESQTTIELTYSSNLSASGNAEQSHQWFMDEVEKRTEGRVTFKRVFDGTLTGATETLPTLRTGAVDLSNPAPTYFPTELPLASMFNGMRVVGDWEASMEAIHKMFFNDGEISEILQKEAEEQNFKYLAWDPMQYMFITKHKVEKLGDLKGLRFRAAGAWDPLFLQELGIIPVNVGPAEMYDALSKGGIDGVPLSLDFIPIFKLNEVTKYISFIDGSIGARPLVINLDTWNSLPADVQQIMTDLIPETYQFGIENYKKMLKESEEYAKNAGMEFVTVDPVEQQKVADTWANVASGEWLPKMKEQGVGDEAEKLLNRYLELAKE